MSKHPRYARFHKCDLQLQTPGDHWHWAGAKTKLTPASSEPELAAAATAYVDRMYEVGLDVVGITDHNMGGALGIRFLEAVLAEIQAQAGGRGKRITVFPGFELVAHTPGAVHLLCLFEPGKSPSEVSDVLSVLGLPPADRSRGAKSDRRLGEVLDHVDGHGGIVVAAHADRANGTLDDRQQAEVWQQAAITDERLLCIELCKPRDAYVNASGKLGMIVRNDPGLWHRSHPVAVVQGSDCKRLDEHDGSGDEGWIGKRHTWIKMSRPSIEGLRQAFLDHESRIRFGDDRPEDLQTHPRIERVTINATRFLADQDIELSPNLNTFIGGGGTGKSTIIGYIRERLGRPPTVGEAASNHANAMATIGTGSVELAVRQGTERLVVPAGDASDQSIADRFPIVAFSQREVFAVAESRQARRSLLDDLQRDLISELAREAARRSSALQALDLDIDRLPALERQKQQLDAEMARLASTLETVESQQAPLARRSALRREQDAVRAIDEALQRVAAQLDTFADDLALGVGRSGFRSPDTPHADAVDALLGRAQHAVADTGERIAGIAQALRTLAESEAQRPERAEWRSALERAEADYRTLVEATGASSDDQPEALRVQLSQRTAEAEALAQQLASLEERAASRPTALAALRAAWRAQVEARRHLAHELRELVPRTQDGAGPPYVEVTIKPFADTTALQDVLTGWVDGRALTPDDASAICDRATIASAGENPVDTVVGWLQQLKADRTPPELVDVLRPAARRRLGELTLAQHHELERLRLDDDVTVLLRRQDGSDAGDLDAGLSVGQRCTAILALALAAGEDPIVIDQPEDEIDNEFIYTELVPLLRAAKNKRQVIISTHNPNLPVNGDAELIYALEARREPKGDVVRGAPKRVAGDEAVGSLDRTAVKEAVSMIMEGSREAFDRRRARYGF